jgi:23S rRNA (guanosine2251-2'-O)-methyltransferase
MIVFGLNPVLEALRAGRVRRLSLSARAGGEGAPGSRRIQEIADLAGRQRVPVEAVPPDHLDRLARGRPHQGVAAEVDEPRVWTPADLVAAAPGPALIVVLDGIEDPHNVGAILRSADGAGAHGVIRQSRHAAPLDGAVARASAGAVSHVRVATVVNIARAVEELKTAGVWAVGLAAEAPQAYDQIDLTMPIAIVVGAEGSGLRRLVRDRCDLLASIPLAGRVSSLNVSVAASVMLFEAVRQRSRRQLEPDPAMPRSGETESGR